MQGNQDPTIPEAEAEEIEGALATRRWLLAVQIFYGLEFMEAWTKEGMSRQFESAQPA